ncbi:MAG TPA: hypothetical protein VJO33_05100 [Gemmatimonadaceae bacterium]|nr:hypothetical protein [Gemmatimonadaceae bacterium]
MTTLSRAVVREVPNVLGPRERPLIVTLAPEGIWFRYKGTRTGYLLPYARGLFTAAKLKADAQLAERLAKRGKRVRARR